MIVNNKKLFQGFALLFIVFLIFFNIGLINYNKKLTIQLAQSRAKISTNHEKIRHLAYWKSIFDLNTQWIGKKLDVRDGYVYRSGSKSLFQNSSSYKVIIYFNQSACAPCLESEMLLWEKKFRRNKHPYLKIFAIGGGGEDVEIFGFKDSRNLKMPFIYDKNDKFELKGINSPIIVLLNKNDSIDFVYFPAVGKPDISEKFSKLILQFITKEFDN